MLNVNQSRETIAHFPRDAGTPLIQHPLYGRTVEVDAQNCTVWSGNTRDLDALKSQRGYKELRSSIVSLGQQIPAIGRMSADSPATVEIVVGASRLAAIRDLNETDGVARLKLRVEFRDLDDEAATALVQAENQGRTKFSPLETARFYKAAVQIHGTREKLAAALGIHKSNVSRTLDVLDLPDCVTALIADAHQISATAASTFMSHWRDDALRPALEAALKALDQRPQSAASVLKALNDSVKPQPPAPITITMNGESVGELRERKDKGLVIELDAIVRSGGTIAIITAIKHALLEMRRD